MKWLSSRLFWGFLLIVGGALLLLSNIGIIEIVAPFWSIIFLIAGVGFLSVFISDRQHWWALIPGIVFLALATIIFVNYTYPDLGSLIAPSILFGGIGLSFVLIYFVDRENWWAIIPAGVLFTLATLTGLSNVLKGADFGGVFFLGLALTFFVVAVLPSHRGELRLAFIPGSILLVIGLLILATLGQWINIVGPSVLIIFGLYLIFRSFRKRA